MRVGELWRYPVKGLRGEQLAQAAIERGGIPGDRALKVVDGRGVVTGRRKQRMVGLQASLAADGTALIAGSRWDSAPAAAALRDVAGETARVVPAEGGHAHDAADVLLVSDGGLAQLGYDRRRFRPNVLVEGVEGAGEQGWIGRQVRVGGALLSVDEPCERCVITTIEPDTLEVDLDVLREVRSELNGILGVYCSVVEPGTVAVGDAVELA